MKAIIYTKICLPCVYEDGWTHIQSWAGVNDVKIKVRRTTYNPLWHELATKAYGDDKYFAFMKIGKKIVNINSLIKMIKESSDDLQGLLNAKRSSRKDCVALAEDETSEKNEGAKWEE